MSAFIFDDPDHSRHRAEEARLIAEKLDDPRQRCFGSPKTLSRLPSKRRSERLAPAGYETQAMRWRLLRRSDEIAKAPAAEGILLAGPRWPFLD
jgi:hypothetical protein